MPKLKEKNAWPNALIITDGVMAEKSGFKKNSRPSPAFGNVSETIQKPSKMTKRMGIMMFDNRSIPFCTPKSKMAMLMPMIMNV